MSRKNGKTVQQFAEAAIRAATTIEGEGAPRAHYVRVRQGSRTTDLKQVARYDLTLETSAVGLAEWILLNAARHLDAGRLVIVELLRVGESDVIDSCELERASSVELGNADGWPGGATRETMAGALVATNVMLSKIVLGLGEQLVDTRGETAEAFLTIGELKGELQALSRVNAVQEKRELYRAAADSLRWLGPHLPGIIEGLVNGRVTADGLPAAERRDTLLAMMRHSAAELYSLLAKQPELREATVMARLSELLYEASQVPGLSVRVERVPSSTTNGASGAT